MFKSVADIVSYINEHYRIFGFRPDQIKLTPALHDELVGHLESRFGPPYYPETLTHFMGVEIEETENVQDGTMHRVLAQYQRQD